MRQPPAIIEANLIEVYDRKMNEYRYVEVLKGSGRWHWSSTQLQYEDFCRTFRNVKLNPDDVWNHNREVLLCNKFRRMHCYLASRTYKPNNYVERSIKKVHSHYLRR